MKTKLAKYIVWSLGVLNFVIAIYFLIGFTSPSSSWSKAFLAVPYLYFVIPGAIIFSIVIVSFIRRQLSFKSFRNLFLLIILFHLISFLSIFI